MFKAVVLSVLLGVSLPVLAENAQRFDIPSQDLASSLNKFAVAADWQIVFAPELVRNIKAPRLEGSFTREEAIRRLLEGSGLEYRFMGAGTVAVSKLGENASAQVGSEGDSRRSSGRCAGNSSGPLGSVAAVSKTGSDGVDGCGGGKSTDSLALARVQGEQPDQTNDGESSSTSDLTDSVQPQEIVVTATKRIERLQDVPSAVTAIRVDNLTKTGMLRIVDYSALVPGLNINDASGAGGQMSPTMRGLTTGAGGRPTLSVFVDDTPVGRADANGFLPDLDPAELERIEVLRGPQGTLYGGGAMGGLIKFVTRAPDYTSFSARMEAGGSTVEDGGDGWSARGSFNVPLSDNLAVRASAFMREDPGFIDNLQTGAGDFNERRYHGGRISIGAALGNNFDVRFSAATQHIEADNAVIEIVRMTGQQVCGGVPCQGLVTRRAPGSEGSEEDNTIYDLRLNGDFGWVALTSSSAFAKNESTTSFDFSPSFGAFVSALYGVPDLGLAFTNLNDSERFTQEFRLTSPSDRFLAWQLGAFYTNEQRNGGQDGRVLALATGDSSGLPPIQVARSDNEFEEIAGYGNVTLHFTSRFDVTLGGRYSENTISSNGVTTTRFGGPASPFTEAAQNQFVDESLTYLINPRYRFNEDLMVYGRVATGYRPGGFNAFNPLSTAPVPRSFGPDEAINYEVGLKTELRDQSLRFDVALYYIDWSDVQVRRSINGISHYDNASSAHSQGAEAEFSWEPINGLTFTGNASYNEAELDESFNVNATTVMPAGSPLPDTPEWATYLSVDYEIPLGNEWAANFGAAWRYVGEREGSLELNPFTLPSYETFDAQAALSNDRYRLTLFARNVSDQRGWISAFPFPPEQVAIIQPRTFGVSVAVSF